MKNIILNENLYHGITPITLTYGNNYEKLSEQIKIFKSIILNKGILSRNKLTNILTGSEMSSLKVCHRINWNKNDWVSITTYPKTNIKCDFVQPYSMSSPEHAFIEYVSENPSIVIDKHILEKSIINDPWGDSYYNGQPGEIQIKDIVPLDYIIGITIPNVIECIEMENLYKKDFYLESLKKLSVDEYLNEFYFAVKLFEEAMKELNYSLPIYDTETGALILSYEEAGKKLSKIKVKL